MNFRGCQIRAGTAFPKFFEPDRKLLPARLTSKKHCPCILEGRLTTNTILTALHHEGLQSNVYVHFQVVNKQLIGISFWK